MIIYRHKLAVSNLRTQSAGEASAVLLVASSDQAVRVLDLQRWGKAAGCSFMMFFFLVLCAVCFFLLFVFFVCVVSVCWCATMCFYHDCFIVCVMSCFG